LNEAEIVLKNEIAIRFQLTQTCTIFAGVAQWLERHVANVNVEGSNPFTRFLPLFCTPGCWVGGLQELIQTFRDCQSISVRVRQFFLSPFRETRPFDPVQPEITPFFRFDLPCFVFL
jgi:hypothetical protein